MSAMMGLVMTDVKRVVAYSTLNSLGLMFLALSAGSVTAAMLYLFAHGFFKALLFLASGSVMHATDEIDAVRFGGLHRKMPMTSWTFLIGALSMAGIIPLAGFWAKDEILVALFEGQNILIFLITFATVVLSALYMARIYILTFRGQPRDHHIFEHAHESAPLITVPLIILAVAAIIGGLVLSGPIMRSLGFPGGFGEFVYSEHHGPHAFQIVPGLFIASIVAAVLGFLAAFRIWLPTARTAEQFGAALRPLYTLSRNKFYMDALYQWIINRIILGIAAIVAWFDRNVVNDSGVDGPALITGFAGYRLKFFQTGKLPNYALLIVVGVLVFIVVAFSAYG
jgi:NADH-quinone oxidoreductase subunit L